MPYYHIVIKDNVKLDVSVKEISLVPMERRVLALSTENHYIFQSFTFAMLSLPDRGDLASLQKDFLRKRDSADLNDVLPQDDTVILERQDIKAGLARRETIVCFVSASYCRVCISSYFGTTQSWNSDKASWHLRRLPFNRLSPGLWA